MRYVRLANVSDDDVQERHHGSSPRRRVPPQNFWEAPALLILTAASQKFSGPLSKSTRIGVLGVEGLQIRYYFSHFISVGFP